MSRWMPSKYYSGALNKENMIPRLLWVNKNNTMKELHFEVFKHMRCVFSEWADWSHPDSTRTPNKDQKVLQKLKFPYKRNPDDPQMTKAEFDALSDEEAFEICCKGIVEGRANNMPASSNFDIMNGAY